MGVVTTASSGSCTVTAHQDAVAGFTAADDSTSFNISPIDPGLTLAAMVEVSLGASPTASATSASAAPIAYGSSTLTTCMVNPSTGVVTTVSVGTCTVTAHQDAAGGYTADDDSTSFNITGGPIDPGLKLDLMADVSFGASPTARATSASPAPVSYGWSTLLVCTVNATSGVVTTVGVGTCTVTAHQDAAGGYTADDDSTSFSIGKATTSTAVASSKNPAKSTDSITFTATVSSAGGTPGGMVIFTIDGVAGSAVALVGGVAASTPRTFSAGSHTVSAAYAGNATNSTSSGSLTPAELIDKIVPKVTLTTPANGAKYAQNKVVTVAFGCTDTGGSLLVSCVGTSSNGSLVDTSILGHLSFTVTGTDGAGNVTTVTHQYSVVDVTKPTVTLNVPGNGATYTLGQLVNADYSCADEAGGSGLKSCVGSVLNGSPINTSTIGSRTFTVTAVDNANHTSRVTVTYKVIWAFSGFVGLAGPPTANPATAGSRPAVFPANDVG